MSDIIHLLPDAVANQIAAGEVIQRPASVVKELVENAIDAQATEVHVLITDSGKTCIQVIDDGKGMSETDARLSFERHATSKIRQAADLFDLRTMGFRGEALASIAAVAEVELKTRPESEELGTKIGMSASKLTGQEVISCPKGSNFSVRNLFFNVPARRKFLKSNATELNNIIQEFERIVLAHPEVAFDLYSNDAELFKLPAEPILHRILSVFGKKLNQDLLPLEVETSIIRISGFIGKPEASRKKGAHTYFFVNGRYMRHPYFHKAVMDAYEKLIPVGDQISYFIYFEVDPGNIDVNIHPTKVEIKFENEQSIWQILAAAVKESLGKFSAVPTIDFDTEGMPNYVPFFDQRPQVVAPKVQIDPTYNPFKSAGNDYARKPVDWEPLYQGIDFGKPTTQSADIFGDSPEAESVVDKEVNLLQFKGRYILTSVKSGLMLIDQHRAHVRVLYDEYMKRFSQTERHVTQGMLFPEMIQLSVAEEASLGEIADEMSAIGFELSSLGNGSYAINGIPAGIEGLDTAQLVKNLIHSAMEKGNEVKEEVRSLLALTLAKASAIVYGQVMSNREMSDLVDRLFACSSPNYTPDGQLILVTIKEEELSRMFSK